MRGCNNHSHNTPLRLSLNQNNFFDFVYADHQPLEKQFTQIFFEWLRDFFWGHIYSEDILPSFNFTPRAFNRSKKNNAEHPGGNSIRTWHFGGHLFGMTISSEPNNTTMYSHLIVNRSRFFIFTMSFRAGKSKIRHCATENCLVHGHLEPIFLYGTPKWHTKITALTNPK